MPWTVTDPMLERARLVALHAEGLHSVAELAARASVSHKTAYKWIDRYAEGGTDALGDRPHVARGHPHTTPPEVEALVVAAREKHPTWGPRKLIPWIAKRHPDAPLPAASTVGTILKRHGLVEPRRRRRVAAHPGSRPLVADAPCDVWTADYKGQFRTGDGEYCFPLTVCDAHSRYVLAVEGHGSVEQYGALRAFDRLFPRPPRRGGEHGLPRSIRTDNGTPFATQAICGLSRLSVWWTKLGITPDRIEPGRPQQNGQHEPARLGGVGRRVLEEPLPDLHRVHLDPVAGDVLRVPLRADGTFGRRRYRHPFRRRTVQIVEAARCRPCKRTNSAWILFGPSFRSMRRCRIHSTCSSVTFRLIVWGRWLREWRPASPSAR